ncbi:adenylosuccinate lyase [Candidatus Roizmanbacteria bacterium RIFCSPHIGHO2_12_FULL_36_11]|nr:MAG: adenylosuccinate lyase [Candidatus Roizmanbacteria bacterium RIFCSPHIGHO2_12_FULL_36_11]
MDPLTRISPLDGRYASQLTELNKFFSDFAYFKYRLLVEIKYLLFLSSEKIIEPITKKQADKINRLWREFSHVDAKRIKTIEDKIKHDVKAIEYFLQEKFAKKNLSVFASYLHLCLTSDDVNNLAYSLMLLQSKKEIILPELKKIMEQLKILIKIYADSAMLGRTHGQPAVPTTFGKELANFYQRLKKQEEKLSRFTFEGKLSGAVGNFNAMAFVFPTVDWLQKSKKFVSSLGLQPNLYTTQILPYDNWIEFFQTLALVNQILMNLSQDVWIYIMLEDLKLKVVEKEVGSSTMPQKVNPINFENAEGNLQIANSLFQFFQNKLSVSRLQRDLSDSPVKRSMGSALGYTIVAWKSLQLGLAKIDVNRQKSNETLNNHWEVLTEAVQTFLRLKKDSKGYDKVKDLVRGKQLNKEDYLELLKQLGLANEEKLVKLKPENYLGLAKKLVGLIK